MRHIYRLIPLLAVAAAAGAQPTSPKSLQVVWRAGGGDDPDTSLAQISSIAVSPKGDVMVWDRKSFVMRLYSDGGKFLRKVGRKGAGPGEYNQISGMAFGPDGRFYVWDGAGARLNVYKPDGDFEKQLPIPVPGFSTNDGLTIDTQGRAWFRFVIFDRAGGKTTGAWARTRTTDGSTIDTVKMPQLPNGDPGLVAQGNGMASYGVPYGRSAMTALTAAGEIMIAPPGKYEIDVPSGGKTVKITRAHTPVPVPSEEREQLKAQIEAQLRRTQPDWTWGSASIPSVKPPIASLTGGLDGRVWASLYVESERVAPDPSVQRPPNAPPPVLYRMNGSKWDIFEPDGRYIGTIVAGDKLRLHAMRGDFAWGTALDDDDVPTLVKLKVTPGFGAR
jgi:hypothetical protein